jgi:hypothetical protein
MSLAADSRSADPQQVIANLRRELDECRAERDEALAQQAAASEVLQVINSSPGDLDPVFEAMVQKAITLCDAASGTLWTCDGEHFDPITVGGACVWASGFGSTARRVPRPTHREGGC